jgi:long-chain acyl-CoA synthetase
VTTLAYLPWQTPTHRHSDPCLRDESQELTYGEFQERVEIVAVQFAAAGVRHGDVVAVMLPNRVELVLCLMAAWRLGAAATPINPTFTAWEADYQIEDSGAVLVVNSGPDAPTGGKPTLSMDQLATTRTGSLEPPSTAPGDTALLIYTSGSTGRPKGVVLDHANLLAMTTMIANHFALTDQDHCLLILPLFHVNAICVSLLASLLRGAQLTMQSRFNPAAFLEAVERFRPTYFSAVPTIYARLAELPEAAEADTSSLRFALCGAAPVSKELLEVCEERFGFVMVEGYGLTEATCATTCNPLTGPRKLGTVGPALRGQQVKIVGEDDRPTPTGTSGEVLIQGPNVMRRYLNRPEETSSTITDGWLHTGDVGWLDDDGYLTLVDRIKDMIIRGGENLYPKEIETVLHAHPAVLEAAVVGRPDPTYGEVPVAYVVAYPNTDLTVEELRDHCRQALTTVKIPADIAIVADIPKNPVGKIDKPALRAALSDARS